MPAHRLARTAWLASAATIGVAVTIAAGAVPAGAGTTQAGGPAPGHRTPASPASSPARMTPVPTGTPSPSASPAPSRRPAGRRAGPAGVSYRGYRFEVPAGWQVVSLAARPNTCVRFDRHVLYLGTPGADENCPAKGVGVTGAVLVQPGPATAKASSVENPVAHQITVTSPRIRVTAVYGSDRAVVRRILASASLPAPVRRMPHPAAAPPRAAARAVAAAAGPGAADFTGKGFDACDAPSSSVMDAWLSSPYRAVGIYFGGADRTCYTQPNLSATWVTDQAAKGWHFIPIYVGPQAAALSSPASQGQSAADDAVVQAQKLGLAPGTPLYYDMEAYSPSYTSAVLSFEAAWTDELHSNGYESGFYSSGASGVTDLVNHYTTDTMPDVIWDAHYSLVDSTNDSYLPAGDWAHHQRIVQYQGGHNETYGGATINIDNDALDVLLPYGGTRQASQAAAQSDGTVDVFYRDGSGTSQLEHAWFHGGVWSSSPQSMGPEGVVGEPSVTTSSPGTVDVFFEGTDGHLWHDFYTTAGGWSGEQDMGMGPLGGPPEAVAQQNGTIDVFWKGTGLNPAMWHAWYDPGKSWAGPQNLGGDLASNPSPVTSSPGTVDVFFQGATNDNLWHVAFNPGDSTWGGAADLGMGPLGGAPHATAQIDGTVDVFWDGTTGGVWHAWLDPGKAWAGPQNLGGQPASDPFAVSSVPGTVDVFFQGTPDGNLWNIDYGRTGGGWQSPANLGMGILGSGPWASAEPTGIMDLFWKGSVEANLWHTWLNPGKSWAGPQDLGGDVG